MFTVLIAQDSSTFRQALREILGKIFPFMRVEEVADGTGVLKMVHAARPNLILLDMSLRGVNGVTLTRRIRSESIHVPIIILGDHDYAEYREAASQAGADYYMAKDSLTGTEIQDLVESLFPREELRLDGPGSTSR